MLRSISVRNKGAQRKMIMEPDSEMEDIAYLSGAIHDGCLVKRRTRVRYDMQFYQKNKDWLNDSVLKRLNRLGIDTPIRGPYKSCFYLKFGNKRLYEILREQVDNVPKDSGLQKLFIRGFWDAEGSCPHVEKYFNRERKRKKIPPQIGFHQNGSPRLLEQVRGVLVSSGIKCSEIDGPLKRPVNKKPEFRFFIYGAERITKFSELVEPEHPEKRMRLAFFVEKMSTANRKL